MIVKLFAALLLAGHLSLSSSQESSPPTVPQSLDNFGGDVSDFSILYTKNLQDIMRKFNIPRAEMEELLRIYVAGGQPKITRTVFNPDTKLNETITLDFKSFEEDSAAGMQAMGTSQGNVPVVFKPNQRASSSIVPSSMPNIPQVGNTGLPSIDDIRLDVVDDPMNPSPDMDLTAMRDNEAKLIEDLKLLQRRRNALQESYAKKEIDQETYRLNMDNNEVQMRNMYVVLQQIQNAIREFLGIPSQGPSAAANAMGDNLLGAQQSPGLVAEDRRLLSDRNLLGDIQDRPLPIQQVAPGGEILSPAEELALIQQELDRMRTRDADLLDSLNRFRMPRVDDNFVSDTTNAASANFVRRYPEGALDLMADDNLPSPAPVPAVSGFGPAASSLLPPSVPETDLSNIRSRTIPTSESGVRENINDLMQEYIRLNRRETDILNMLGDSNSQQLIGTSVIPLQNNRPNIAMPQARQNTVRERTSRTNSFPDPNNDGVNTLPTLPENLRFNTMDDNNRIERTEPVLPSSSLNNRLINDLLSQYNELNQRESEIQQLLDSQLDQNAIGRNELFDRNQPQTRKEFERSIDLDEPNQNIGPVAVGGDRPRDFQMFQTDNLPDQTLRVNPDGLGGSLDQVFTQSDTSLDQNTRPDTRPFDRMRDQTLGPDTRQFDTTLNSNLRPDDRIFSRTFDRTLRPATRRINRMFDQPLRPDDSMLVDSVRFGGRSVGSMFDRFSRPDDRRFNNLSPFSTEMNRPLSRPFDINDISSTDRPGLLSNDRALDRSRMLSGESNFDRSGLPSNDRALDRTRMLSGAINFDSSGRLSNDRDFDRSRMLSGESNFDRSGLLSNDRALDRSRMLSGASNFDRSGLPSNDRALDRTRMLSGAINFDSSGRLSNDRDFDRSTMLPGATNFDDITFNNLQGSRPTPLTGSALGRRTDESLASSRGDSTNNNLVYNDGTITIESVRPAGTYDEGDLATPLETGPVSEFPVSGFSRRASGLLTPSLDSLSLRNRMDPRLGRDSVSSFRRRSLYPFVGNRMLQQDRMRRARQTLF